jgi:hypothetical protein
MSDDAYRYMADYIDGQVLGADSGMNILVSRSDYLYPFGIMPYFMFMQKAIIDENNSGTPSWFWEGSTIYRSHHPTFYFSAGVEIKNPSAPANAGYVFSLDVWVIDATGYGSWQTLDSDDIYTTSANILVHFKGTRINSYNIATWLSTNGYTLQNDTFRVRFCASSRLLGSEFFTAMVFTAYFQGWVSAELGSWTPPPTIVDGALSSADIDINPMINNQNYLKKKTETNLQPMYRYVAHQRQSIGSSPGTSTGTVGRFAFHYRPSTMGTIYYRIGVQNLFADDKDTVGSRTEVRVWLQSYDYFDVRAIPSTGGTYSKLLLNDLPTVNGTAQSHTWEGTYDLTSVSPALTPGETYKLMFEVINYRSAAGDLYEPHVEVRELSICPKSTDGRSAGLHKFAHLEQPAAAYINAMYDDLTEMETGGKYAIEYTHPLVTWMNHTEAGVPPLIRNHEGTDTTSMVELTGARYVICHRMRWLKFIGPARIQSLAETTDDNGNLVPEFEETISELLKSNDANGTTSVSVMQTLDLNSLTWLAPGMYYCVRDARVAFEDYDLNPTDLT